MSFRVILLLLAVLHLALAACGEASEADRLRQRLGQLNSELEHLEAEAEPDESEVRLVDDLNGPSNDATRAYRDRLERGLLEWTERADADRLRRIAALRVEIQEFERQLEAAKGADP